ncbi:thioesterase family protein [Nocardioides dongxiaopingii]|uniref:thioesterase family protein n=1 Tax=Nocardioides sp. S-1144 TaxID=2582905 RepID=UPI00110E25D9|nr:thioesterase family protein [Nocardioides sp. S-1144]QCW49813.1 thioesterase family protein [Nocardioides sp. S-1144]
MAYFRRTGATTFLATRHVGGAWDPGAQHVAAALGLLAHAVEVDRDRRRDDGLVIGRLAYDILGTVPVAEVEVAVDVVRPGRTIELVEATLAHGGRVVVRLRAWLLQPGDTHELAATPLAPIAPPDAHPAWDATAVWPGGFIESVEVRRVEVAPGRATSWVRSDLPLLAGEPVSDLASAARLLDIANGLTVRADPARVAFPNVDLTAHLARSPRGEWVGLDTSVTFGPGGLGITSSVLHDEHGPVGTLAQLLTVRPAG